MQLILLKIVKVLPWKHIQKSIVEGNFLLKSLTFHYESPSFLFVMACVRTRAPLVCFPYIIDTRPPFSLRPEGQRRGTTQHRLYFTWQVIPDIIFPCMKVILLPELEVQSLRLLYSLLSRIKWQLQVELNQYLLSNIQIKIERIWELTSDSEKRFIYFRCTLYLFLTQIIISGMWHVWHVKGIHFWSHTWFF